MFSVSPDALQHGKKVLEKEAGMFSKLPETPEPQNKERNRI